MSTVEELLAEIAQHEAKQRELRGQIARLWDEAYRASNARDYWKHRFDEMEAGRCHD